jgi:hypothetical protein
MISNFKKSIKVFYQKQVIKKAGVWFIDIPKTSTTSIRKELGNKFGSTYDKSNLRFSIPAHQTSNDMISFLESDIWKSLFTFSIVRNPWDKTLSFFLWSQKNGYFLNMSFKDFVLEIKKQFETGSSHFTWHGPYESCSFYLLSKTGDFNVDFVGKFENREEALETIRTKINTINKNNKFNIKEFGNVSVNTSTKNIRHDFYNDELISIISKVYSDDLVNFNYKESDYF